MFLNFHVSTCCVGDALFNGDLRQDDRNQDAPGRGRVTGMEVVTAGSDTSGDLQVGRSEERVSRPRVTSIELHSHFPRLALVIVIISQ